MVFRKKGVNKVGYSSFVGLLFLAYFSEKEPLSSGLYFLIGFAVTFILILALELVSEPKDRMRH